MLLSYLIEIMVRWQILGFYIATGFTIINFARALLELVVSKFELGLEFEAGIDIPRNDATVCCYKDQ